MAILVCESPNDQMLDASHRTYRMEELADATSAVHTSLGDNVIICFDQGYSAQQIAVLDAFITTNGLKLIVAGNLRDDHLFKRYETLSPTFMVDATGDMTLLSHFIAFLEHKISKAAQDRQRYMQMLEDYKIKLRELEAQLTSMTGMLEELSNTAATLMESEWEKENELENLRNQLRTK